MKPTTLSLGIVLAFAGYFGYHTVFLQGQHKVSKLREQLTDEEQTQALRNDLARSLEELERLRKRLPQDPESEWLVREVGKLAEGTGVQLTSIVPDRPKQLEAFTHLVVRLRFETSYHQLGKFVSALESARSFLRVDELELSPGREKTAQAKLIVSTVSVPSLADVPRSQEATTNLERSY